MTTSKCNDNYDDDEDNHNDDVNEDNYNFEEENNYTDDIKDARSASLYPYYWSQILQYVKYTKQINIVKGIANLSDK